MWCACCGERKRVDSFPPRVGGPPTALSRRPAGGGMSRRRAPVSGRESRDSKPCAWHHSGATMAPWNSLGTSTTCARSCRSQGSWRTRRHPNSPNSWSRRPLASSGPPPSARWDGRDVDHALAGVVSSLVPLAPAAVKRCPRGSSSPPAGVAPRTAAVPPSTAAVSSSGARRAESRRGGGTFRAERSGRQTWRHRGRRRRVVASVGAVAGPDHPPDASDAPGGQSFGTDVLPHTATDPVALETDLPRRSPGPHPCR